MAGTKSAARPLTDHDEIRRWAQERNAKPACARCSGGGTDIGMIRLGFPGGEGSLEEISWSDWFQKFDESNLALLVQEQTARGEKSNLHQLASREPVEQSGRKSGHTSSRSSTRGSRWSETSNSQSASFNTEEVDSRRRRPEPDPDRGEGIKPAGVPALARGRHGRRRDAQASRRVGSDCVAQLHAAHPASEARPGELRPAPQVQSRGLAARTPAGHVGARTARKLLGRSQPAGRAGRAADRAVDVLAVVEPLHPEYWLAHQADGKKAGPEERNMSRPCAIVARILDPPGERTVGWSGSHGQNLREEPSSCEKMGQPGDQKLTQKNR